MAANVVAANARLLELEAFAELIPLLGRRGYEVIGPVIRDGAVVYDAIESAAELPAGWTAETEAGIYRLKKREDGALFSYGVGLRSLKRFFHPADARLFGAGREDGTFRIITQEEPRKPYAFIGVRACELAAMERQDRVLLRDRYLDCIYEGRRKGAFLVAVNCAEPAATCFCQSMGTGPKVEGGADIVLTEVIDGDHHYFLAEAGSEAGGGVLAELKSARSNADTRKKAQAVTDRAAEAAGRAVDTKGLRELLYERFDDPRWDQTASRCLSCANCTMVCPTCFCVTVEDSSNITLNQAERWRRWDSCFTQNFSYIHGGSVRLSVKSRYRQWLTHKFASWQDQFGEGGCVGCGRCITWCPVGIDVTEEIKALRGGQAAAVEAS